MTKITGGIFGVQSMQVELSPTELATITLELVAGHDFDTRQLYEYTEWNDLFPGNAIIPCQYCKQWGARKSCCKHCGGAIE